MGDDCLRKVAKSLAGAAKRPADLAARYGGEEFAVILPNTPGPGALHVADLILNNVRSLQIPHEKSIVEPYVTLSLGVASLIPDPKIASEELVKTADDALYEAKETGRNRAILKSPDNI
jgi:two-component system cell cycle response regulator